ncbi:cystathionine beta-synthase [Micrococcales bacterium 31B]|nr:cystathionine beta-synthase [Micrococcales bacterium 31B]
MKYASSIVDLIGNTPLVRLNSVTNGLSATILAKIEYLNPGGSSKDRIAAKIIEAAEREGRLQPGGTIVEPTSGNTGIGLALFAQQRGYRCVFVCPDKVSEDKRNVLKAYGAEVVVCPTNVEPSDPRSYYRVSDRLAAEIPGGFKPNQYSNLNGPESHYETTGPEIWDDTDGAVTHFVAGVGTGGTITGTGRYLKEVSGGAVQVIGADPDNSVYSGGSGRSYLVEGVGEDFWPEAFDRTLPDAIVAASDAECFEMTRRLAREEGLLVGGSCGLAVIAAVKYARELEARDPEAAARAVIVVLLPDGGRGYLNKIFSDSWMYQHGFAVESEDAEAAAVGGWHERAGSPEPHVLRSATLGQAIDVLRTTDVVPVYAVEPPVTDGEMVGSLSSGGVLAALARGASLDESVADHLEPVLPKIGTFESVERLRELLIANPAVSVMRLGKPVGVLHREHVLGS